MAPPRRMLALLVAIAGLGQPGSGTRPLTEGSEGSRWLCAGYAKRLLLDGTAATSGCVERQEKHNTGLRACHERGGDAATHRFASDCPDCGIAWTERRAWPSSSYQSNHVCASALLRLWKVAWGLH